MQNSRGVMQTHRVSRPEFFSPRPHVWVLCCFGVFCCFSAWAGLSGCPLTIEPSEDTREMLVGSPCENPEDCEEGTCLLTMVRGYCTLPCLNEPCPTGSRCVIFEMLGIRDGMCLRSCEISADCGRPGYFCGPALDGGATVCGSARVESP